MVRSEVKTPMREGIIHSPDCWEWTAIFVAVAKL